MGFALLVPLLVRMGIFNYTNLRYDCQRLVTVRRIAAGTYTLDDPESAKFVF